MSSVALLAVGVILLVVSLGILIANAVILSRISTSINALPPVVMFGTRAATVRTYYLTNAIFAGVVGIGLIIFIGMYFVRRRRTPEEVVIEKGIVYAEPAEITTQRLSTTPYTTFERTLNESGPPAPRQPYTIPYTVIEY